MRIKLSDKYQNEREEICNKIITISSFKPNFDCKRPYLNIIRSILRKQNYNFIGNDYTIKINNNPKKTIKYVIFRNN
jgi:hypothetical protein